MSDEVVRVNVGGIVYEATARTLTSRDGLLPRLLAHPQATRDAHGCLFIDRNGGLFRYVLDFLRDGELNPPQGFADWGALRREFEYYFGGSFSDFEFQQEQDGEAAAADGSPPPPHPAAASPAAPIAGAYAGGDIAEQLRKEVAESREEIRALREAIVSPNAAPPGVADGVQLEADGVVVLATPLPSERRVVMLVAGEEVGSARRLTYDPVAGWVTNEVGEGYALPQDLFELRQLAMRLANVADYAGVPHSGLAPLHEPARAGARSPGGSPYPGGRGSPAHHPQPHTQYPTAGAGLPPHGASPLTLSPFAAPGRGVDAGGAVAAPMVDAVAAHERRAFTSLMKCARRQVRQRSARGEGFVGVRPPTGQPEAEGLWWSVWDGPWGQLPAATVLAKLVDDGFDVVAPGYVVVAQDDCVYRCQRSSSGRDLLSVVPAPAAFALSRGFAVVWARDAITITPSSSGSGRLRVRFADAVLRDYAFGGM